MARLTPVRIAKGSGCFELPCEVRQGGEFLMLHVTLKCCFVKLAADAV